MRRKSNRNATKVATEKSIETSVRTTRRQSRRNKIASSQSSSEESDDGNAVETSKKAMESTEPAEQIQDNAITDETGTKQTVWKVTSSTAPSGEIQKLKFSLTRSIPSSPEKNEKPVRRRRNKTGSQCDEDVGSPEDKMCRKTRNRGLSSANVEEQAEEIDEQEEKKIKGKSKTKHRSKSEKTPHIQDVEDQIQSEISENVQVTPQSPQAGVNIRVDNESVSTNECETETQSVEENSSADKICEVEDQAQSEISENEPVTPRSPQTGVNIRVDNEMQSVEENPNANKICDVEDQNQSEISENVLVIPQSPQAGVDDIGVKNESVSTDECTTETQSVEENSNADKICDGQDQRQSEISENVPVTAESSQTSVNIRIYNEYETETQSVEEDSNADKICDDISNDSVTIAITETLDQRSEQNDINCSQECIVDVQGDVLHVPVEGIQSIEVVVNQEEDSTIVIEQDVQLVEQSNEEVVVELAEQEVNNETVMVSEEQIEISNSDTIDEVNQIVTDTSVEEDKWENNEETTIASDNKDNEESSQVIESQDSKSESSSSEETGPVNSEPATSPRGLREKDEPENVRSDSPSPIAEKTIKTVVLTMDEDSRSNDVSMDNNSTISTRENTSLNLRRSLCSDIAELVEENTDVQQSTKKPVCEFDQSSPVSAPHTTERKWGDSLTGLGLLKPFLYKIDISMFKEFVPNLQLLDENEIKLDIHESKDRRRSYSIESREKWKDRRGSMEGRSEEAGHKKRLDSQTSMNSETEEMAESEVDNSNIIAMNRKISIVDDTASKLKPPPSPAKNPVSQVLYITNLVRPFTLKQLKELLERTGKLKENGFWTDRIKSKCYVSYETVEDSEATRNALHGVHWPIGNGKKLMIDYATDEDLEKARNPPPPPPQPLPLAVATAMPELKVAEKEIQASEAPPKRSKSDTHEKGVKEREHRRSDGHIREWDIGKENLHKLHARNDGHADKNERRKHRRSPTPDDDFISRKHRKKEEDVPQKLMDDLFCRTKATPNIYWLPLTPEEIATKQQQRLLRMAEHKRRMEESSRGRGDYGRGAPYRRRYD